MERRYNDSTIVAQNRDKHWFLFYHWPMIIICGGLANILAFVITCRGRLWRKSEGYIYLLAAFITNFTKLTIITGQNWIYLFTGYKMFCSSYQGCRAYFFMSDWLTPVTAWLLTGFLFDVYVQRSLGKDRQCSAGFAQLFCRTSVAAGVVCAVFALTACSALIRLLEFLALMAKGLEHGSSSNFFRGDMWFFEKFVVTVAPVLCLIPLLFILLAVRGGKKPDNTTQQSEVFDSFRHFPRAAVLCLALALWVFQIPQGVIWLIFRIYIIEFRIVVFDSIQVLFELSYLLVPIVCLAMMPEFRGGVRQLFFCCKRKRSSPESAGEEIPLAAGQIAVPANC